MNNKLKITAGNVSLAELRQIYCGSHFEVEEHHWQNVVRSAAMVKEVLSSGQVVYGINTGFGRLANTRIEDSKLKQLQLNLIRSHCTGVGEHLNSRITRFIMVLKAVSLIRGFSGVQPDTIKLILRLIEHNALPLIPAQGSVGASGDLAPLAHMSLALIGEGNMLFQGQRQSASKVLDQLELKPVTLAPKEGLALINGTQVSTALALSALFEYENTFASATIAGALTIDAALASGTPFDARIHAVRGQSGQQEIAAVYRELIAHSEIRNSHEDCGKVQDPYSLRCQPQVMGACLDHLRFIANILLKEANAVTDNPLVFNGENDIDILSGGNFHAEIVAMASDVMALAICETGSLSERRIAMLTDTTVSSLPPFLVSNAGLNSGFMIAHVSAAALTSENKQLSHPACVDSIPTSANQEDHVSMATHGAKRLHSMVNNLQNIIAIEILCAVQGIDFHAPLKTSPTLTIYHALVRDQIPFLNEDRYFAADIEKVVGLIRDQSFVEHVKTVLPSY